MMGENFFGNLLAQYLFYHNKLGLFVFQLTLLEQ